jgi:hypothetical protein
MSINNKFLQKKVAQLHFLKNKKCPCELTLFQKHFLGFSQGQQKFSENFEKGSWPTFFFKTAVFVVVVFQK